MSIHIGQNSIRLDRPVRVYLIGQASVPIEWTGTFSSLRLSNIKLDSHVCGDGETVEDAEQKNANVITRDDAEITGLLEYWKQTIELRNDQITTFDKSVLWASGGALALTIANVEKISGPTGVTPLLIYCWASFTASIAVNIISYWTSAQDSETELRKIRASIEKETHYSHGNFYRAVTSVLNFSALLLFIVGISFLLAHSYVHLMEPLNDQHSVKPI